MTEQDAVKTLDAITGFAVANLAPTEHHALLHLLKRLLEAGLAAAMSVELTAETGDLVREDSRPA